MTCPCFVTFPPKNRFDFYHFKIAVIIKKLDFDYFLLLFKIEALRNYFKSKNAKLDSHVKITDIQENLNDLIKNLDSVYNSDVSESGKLRSTFKLSHEKNLTVFLQQQKKI